MYPVHYPTLNICTAILPDFNFINMLDVMELSYSDGIELRVHDIGHCSLQQLEEEGEIISKRVAKKKINLPVLNTYVGVEDKDAVDRLLACCKKMKVPKIRLVLPRSCNANVSTQANINEFLPSYDSNLPPAELVTSLRATLKELEHKAKKHDVQVLLELHWGTVMSSFSSAYILIHDLDPAYIALTVDPANMLVEGKEDWEFGFNLVKEHIANIHLKNMSWNYEGGKWQWSWDSIENGMVDWEYLISLLIDINYTGDYSIEDFQTPQSHEMAIYHLLDIRKNFMMMYGEIAASKVTPLKIAA